MGLYNRTLAATLAIFLGMTAADAATFKYTINTGANNSGAPGGDSENDRQTAFTPFTAPLSFSSASNNGSSGAAAQIFADGQTGVIRLSSSATSTTDANDVSARATSTAVADFSVFETYQTVGTGTITFFADYDGSLVSELTAGASPFFVSNQVLAALTLRKPGFNRQDLDTFGTSTEGIGRFDVDETASVSLDLDNNEEFEMLFNARTSAGTNLFGGGISAGASADFTNTFTLRFETTGTLQVTPSDANFLSGGGTTGGGGGLTPVPVPASLPLLVAGLGLVGVMGRRKRRAA